MKPDLKVLKPEDAPKPPQDEKQTPAQAEMPFAVVDGEPVTALPQDLYIPPYALQVFLEAFEGPLDLLLYLIRRQNIDILDIPIAEITKQYVQYIELMHELQLELAGEYLLMAAMLAEIKSRMLLPRPEVEAEEEDDPRAELVRRLQEYERYKKAAEDIGDLPRLERDVFVATRVRHFDRDVRWARIRCQRTDAQAVRALDIDLDIEGRAVLVQDVVKRHARDAHRLTGQAATSRDVAVERTPDVLLR